MRLDASFSIPVGKIVPAPQSNHSTNGSVTLDERQCWNVRTRWSRPAFGLRRRLARHDKSSALSIALRVADRVEMGRRGILPVRQPDPRQGRRGRDSSLKSGSALVYPGLAQHGFHPWPLAVVPICPSAPFRAVACRTIRARLRLRASRKHGQGAALSRQPLLSIAKARAGASVRRCTNQLGGPIRGTSTVINFTVASRI